MNAWLANLALITEADRAANRCIACGKYGHYPVECPKESLRLDVLREKFQLLEPTQMHSEFWPRLIVGICGVVAGACAAWLAKGWL